MSETFKNICNLVSRDLIRVSDHGYNELAEDKIFVRDIISGIQEALVVEDYPEYPKGACVLVLQRDKEDKPVHVVWGIPKGYTEPAVLVTAYRPDSERWTNDYLRRRP